MDLNAVLSDAPLPTREPLAVETDEKDPPEAFSQQEEPATSSVAKVEPPQAEQDEKVAKPEAKPEKAEPMVPLSALLAERARRKEEPKQKTDIFENPEKAREEIIAEAQAPLKAAFFNLSLKAASKFHSDFDAAAQAFSEASEKDPGLVERLRTHDDPGEFIYSVGLQLKEMAEVGGDFAKYREKIRGDAQKQIDSLSTQLQAAQQEIAALKTSKDKAAKIPQSLNAEPSGVTKGDAFAGPRPLKDILN